MIHKKRKRAPSKVSDEKSFLDWCGGVGFELVASWVRDKTIHVSGIPHLLMAKAINEAIEKARQEGFDAAMRIRDKQEPS